MRQWRTSSKTGNKKSGSSFRRTIAPSKGNAEAGFRIFSLWVVWRFPFLLDDDGRGNRLWKQKCHFVGVWATQNEDGGASFLFSWNTPLCSGKGVCCFADRNGAVFACFLCFWKPQKLYAKPNVLLNTLHILNQVPRLTLQEGTDCVEGFPWYQFPMAQLLEIGLPYQLILTNFGRCIALLFKFCQHIDLVADCHIIRLLFHCPYSIITMH